MSLCRCAIGLNLSHFAQAALPVCALAFLFTSISAGAHAQNLEDKRGALFGQEQCPPDNTNVAILTRQAFDEGRAFESREYGKFIDQLVGISQLRRPENEITQQSLELSRQFIEKLNSRGHGVNIGDIIIHRETTLNQRIKSRSTDPIAQAQFKLELAVILEMKRLICR